MYLDSAGYPSIVVDPNSDPNPDEQPWTTTNWGSVKLWESCGLVRLSAQPENKAGGSTSSATAYPSLTATLIATRGEQPWTLANYHELSIMKISASMDVGGRWWTMSAAIS